MSSSTASHGPRRGERGQILVIAALGLVAMIGMSALVLEGGNAYAQQRVTQNGADAAANAGATVLARRLAGALLTDADVAGAVTTIGGANSLDQQPAYYTDIQGRPLDTAGNVVAEGSAAAVGGGTIPPGAQGVAVRGSRTFGTFFGRAIGFNSFSAGASATAVTGRLVGGNFLPVIFPINIVDCETNGDLGTGEENWQIAQPSATKGAPPIGPEYLIPLCKTGTGQFMILDLDASLKCDEEVATPPAVAFNSFPTYLNGDEGNDCMKKVVDEVNKKPGKVYMVPICDDECTTTGGGNAQYKVVKVAAFWIDYMSESNNPNNPACQPQAGLIPIAGNGSSSCIAGWFVRYVTRGPVGQGPIGNSDAIGVQLIQ